LLLVRKRSALTAESYVRELENLERFLAERGKNPQGADGEDLLSFLVFRQRQGLSRTTMARLVASLHSLYKFMKMEGLRRDDPSQLIRTPRQERTLPEVLRPEEVDKFLASIDLSTPNGLRDRALFELIYSCGLRISEAASLSFDRLYMKEKLLRWWASGKRKESFPSAMMPITG
jgi:integrase/recombinase XerD